jgi:hypothetical protein
MKDLLLDVMETLLKHSVAEIFKRPVKESDAPGYSEVIKHPIDLGTLRKHIRVSCYGIAS